jgi:nicotinamidase-related amidase
MKLDPKKTAVLTLDLQNGIFGMVPGADVVIAPAAKAVEFARQKGFLIIHVGLGFSKGHPEIPEGSRFSMVKEKGIMVKGSASAEFHPSILKADDIIVYKQRVSGFSQNELTMILRAQKIENLVMFGIATSGITLSTLRQASDLDFKCTILKDGCADRDEEVHRVLTEKVFPGQATVLTVDEFIVQQN